MELSSNLFWKVQTCTNTAKQTGTYLYLTQQVHLIVCWPLYRRIKECHWRVRYLTRLGSGLYGGGGLQWEADTIVWLLWPPFISPLACMWWLLSMFEPVRKGWVINKIKITKNCDIVVKTCFLGIGIFWSEIFWPKLLKTEHTWLNFRHSPIWAMEEGAVGCCWDCCPTSWLIEDGLLRPPWVWSLFMLDSGE